MDQGWTTPKGPLVDHPKRPPRKGAVREVGESVHMRPMNASTRILRALALTALIAAGTAGCSTSPAPAPAAAPMGGEDRVGSVDSPIPSAPHAALAAQVAAARLQLNSSRVNEFGTALIVPDRSVGAAAHEKVCEYTAAAVNAAVSHGYGIPSVARATAAKILAGC